MVHDDAPAVATLTVRALDAEDANGARALLLPAWDGEHPQVEAMLSRLDRAARQESAESLALVAVIGPTVVGLAIFGMVAGSLGTAAVHGVYVAEEIRGRGAGSALMRGLLKVLNADHARLLVAEVPDDDAHSVYRQFLSRQGFFMEGRVPDLVRDGVAMTLWRFEPPGMPQL